MNIIKPKTSEEISNTEREFNYDRSTICESIKNSLAENDYTVEEIKAFGYYQKGKIIENIQQYIQKISNENRDISENEIVDKIKGLLKLLTKSEREHILTIIGEITKKFNTVRKYTDFESGPYKSPLELLCAMRGISDPRIIDIIGRNITFKRCGPGIIFFTSNERYCYNFVITGGESGFGNGSSGSFFREESNIDELKGTLIVIKGNGKDKVSNRMEKHDLQHLRNTFLMPKDESPIGKAKDEIIAYLRDGRGIFKKSELPETIESLLTGGSDEYQYGLEGEERENHKRQVKELLSYANDLIELSKDEKTGLKKENIISMLLYTPVNQRKELHSNIMIALKIHNEKHPLKDEKLEKEQYTKGKIKQHIINLRKSNFQNHTNLSNGVRLWRTKYTNKQ